MVAVAVVLLASIGAAACQAAAAELEAAAEVRVGDLATGVIELAGGGGLPGHLAAAEAPAAGSRATLVWKSPLFLEPFEFQVDEVGGVRFTAPRPPAPPQAFRCRLHGGDAIDGDLDGLDADHVAMATGSGQVVRIERTAVEAVERLGAANVGGYVGPGGLAGWEQSPEASWQDEGGRIFTSLRGSSVIRDVAGPPRASYDIVLSWKRKPEFRIAPGAGESGTRDPYRLEFLDVDGMPAAAVARQEPDDARLTLLEIDPAATRLHLRLFVDQHKGRFAGVVLEGGRGGVREVSLPPRADRQPSGRLRFTLDRGDVCVESIRVAAWTADDPLVDERPAAAVLGRDGRVLGGDVVSFDKAAGELRLGDGSRVRLAAVDAVVFPTSAAASDSPDDTRPDSPQLRVVRRSGAVLTGGLVSVDDRGVRLSRRHVVEPVVLPLEEIVSFVGSGSQRETRPLPARVGTLTVGDATLRGGIVDGSPWNAGIAWMPVGSVTASPFAPAAAGPPAAILEYVPRPRRARPEMPGGPGQVEVGGIGGVVNQDPAGGFVVAMLSEEGAAARDGRLRAGDRVLAIKPRADGGFVATKGLDVTTVMNLLRGRVGTPLVLKVDGPGGGDAREIDLERGLIYVGDRSVLDEALATHERLAGAVVADGKRAAAGFPALLILASGDVVPAQVEGLDERGVRLRTPVADAPDAGMVVVDVKLVKAIELDPAVERRDIDRVRADRLLMLPRSQRFSPPSHLVRLRDGDYLRGRVERLDASTLTLEVRGEVKKLPRASVARIIWLHPETERSADAADPGTIAADASQTNAADGEAVADGLMVQGVSQGRRMTLVARRVEEGAIRGRSPAFGDGRIELDQVDRLLIGGGIASEADERPYGQWKLRPAPEPRALRDEPTEPGPKS